MTDGWHSKSAHEGGRGVSDRLEPRKFRRPGACESPGTANCLCHNCLLPVLQLPV
jgi:hypothetical protein